VGSFGLTALGFILGMVVFPLLVRWVALLHTTLGSHGGDFLGPPKRRLLWAAPLVVLVHPVPYFLVGAVAVGGLALRGRISSGWLWLLLGFGVYALFMAAMVAPILLRARNRRTPRDS
jgi:hypothetical protein